MGSEMTSREAEFPLQAGEEHGDARDSAHWIGVYEELMRFVDSVLPETELTGREALLKRRHHLETRLRYWLRRSGP